MTTGLNPYLGFRDNAKQAMEFYRSVFGGELTMSTFAELNPRTEAGDQDKIMHAMLETPSGFVLMASDTPASMDYSPGNNFSVSLSGDDNDELTGYWEKLIVDGTVTEPLTTAPWGDSFGMCVDRFGVAWLVNITAPAA
jgi:PhnB protein